MGDSASKVIAFPKAKSGPVAKARARRIIAVGGGKGGIGKSLVSSSLGIALSRKGAKVVMIDADLGGANLHTCLGIAQPKVTLSDFIERRVDRLEDIVLPTPYPGLALISGAQDMLDAANPHHASKQKLLRHVKTLDVDFVVLDLGAGTSYNVLDFFLLADLGLVVLLPEPTSIENAYRFIKAAFFRRLQAVEADSSVGDLIEAALSGRAGAPKTPWELFEKANARSPEAADRLRSALADFRPHLLVNQVRTRADYDVGGAVVAAWKKFFGLELGYLGSLSHDDAAWKSVRARKAVMELFPDSAFSQGVLRVAENLIAWGR